MNVFPEYLKICKYCGKGEDNGKPKDVKKEERKNNKTKNLEEKSKSITDSTIYCPKCKLAQNTNAKFCRACGSEIAPLKIEKVSYCENCGSSFPEEYQYCENDGNKLKKIVTEITDKPRKNYHGPRNKIFKWFILLLGIVIFCYGVYLKQAFNSYIGFFFVGLLGLSIMRLSGFKILGERLYKK